MFKSSYGCELQIGYLKLPICNKVVFYRAGIAIHVVSNGHLVREISGVFRL